MKKKKMRRLLSDVIVIECINQACYEEREVGGHIVCRVNVLLDAIMRKSKQNPALATTYTIDYIHYSLGIIDRPDWVDDLKPKQ